MSNESIWSDEPPTEAGMYYVKWPTDSEEVIYLTNAGEMFALGGKDKLVKGTAMWPMSFGPRVPDAATCHRIMKE